MAVTINNNRVPIALTIAGSDSGGGAGIQADIEALASMGCHAAPVVTTITVQDSQGVKGAMPLDPDLVIEQARAVLEDMPVACFKIGLLGSVEVVEVVHSLLADYPDIPVVLDPVLVPVEARPAKPFQGWRYLKPEEAPPDVAQERPVAQGLDLLPPKLRRDLAELCLI